MTQKSNDRFLRHGAKNKKQKKRSHDIFLKLKTLIQRNRIKKSLTVLRLE